MNYNTEHERALLGAIKLDNSVYDDTALFPADFYDECNRTLYCAIGRIIESGSVANDVSIAAELERVHSSVSPSEVIGLDIATAANAKYYADSVRGLSRKRALDKLIIHAHQALSERDPGEVVEILYQGLGAVADSGGEIKKIGDVLHDSIEDIEQLYNAKGAYAGVVTGFKDLDDLTNGFQPEELIIIACRPSIGKTALALCMATNIVVAGTPAGFFSCEMSIRLLMRRVLASEAKINLASVRDGALTNQDFNHITGAAGRLYDAPLYLDDTPNIALSTLRSRARQMHRRGVKVIFID